MVIYEYLNRAKLGGCTLRAHYNPYEQRLSINLGRGAARPTQLIDELASRLIIRRVSYRSTLLGLILILDLRQDPYLNPYGVLQKLATVLAELFPQQRAVSDPWRAPEPTDLLSAVNLIGLVFQRQAQLTRTR